MSVIRPTRHLNKLFILGTVTFTLTYLLLQTSTVRHIGNKVGHFDVGTTRKTSDLSTMHSAGSMLPESTGQNKLRSSINISTILNKETDLVFIKVGITVRKKKSITTPSPQPSSSSTTQASTTSPPIINPHPFKYVLHPGNVCSHGNTYLFVYVHSAPTHYKHRLLIRQTWGNPRPYSPTKVKVVFILGLSQLPQTNAAVRYESDMYGDIVQEDFMDAYKNLTYKGVAGLRYVSENCRNASYVMKTDDDVVVNVYALLQQLQDAQTDALIMCLTWYHMKVAEHLSI